MPGLPATPPPGGRPDRPAAPGLLGIDIRTDADDRTTTLVARGEVDLSTRTQFSSALDAAWPAAPEVDRRVAHLVLDLRQVVFIDCGGVGTLARTVRSATAHQVRLQLLTCPALDELVSLLGGWNALVDGVDGPVPEQPSGR